MKKILLITLVGSLIASCNAIDKIDPPRYTVDEVYWIKASRCHSFQDSAMVYTNEIGMCEDSMIKYLGTPGFQKPAKLYSRLYSLDTLYCHKADSTLSDNKIYSLVGTLKP